MTDAVFGAVGLVGVAFYLGAYAALQIGLIRGSSYSYTVLNLFGASFVLISLITDFNLASLLIQVSWILISIIGLTRMYLRSRNLRFTAEEREMLKDRLANLPKASAKEFLNAGGWIDLPKGEVLLNQDSRVANLFYLSTGSVSVFCDDQEVAALRKGFLGEINILQGGPASATVKTTSSARLFVISREELKRLMINDADLRAAIETSLSRELGQRLMQANQRLITQAWNGEV